MGAPLPPLLLPNNDNIPPRALSTPALASLSSPRYVHSGTSSLDRPNATDQGSALVVAYVTRTGDIQSAGLLFCHAVHLKRPPVGLRRFFMQYAALLARWQMHR